MSRDKTYYLFYNWRLVATGLSFAIFGVGGALLSLTLLLTVYIAPLSKESKMTFSRRAISMSFCLYITLLKRLGLMTYETHDLEKLNRPGQLIIANHPSLLDVVFLISFIKNANCVVKNSLWRNPFTFGPVSAAGYLPNDAKNLLDLCAESLQSGSSLIIFPEGTRSVPNQPFRLLRGAANIALTAKTDLTPVIIQCQPATLLKEEKWYSIPATPPHYVFQVLPDIELNTQGEEVTLQSKAARQLTDMIGQLFTHYCQSAPQIETCRSQAKGEAVHPSVRVLNNRNL